MAAESQSQKKSYCIVGDVYRGVMIVPKELDLSPTKDLMHHQINLQLKFPDVGRAFTNFTRTREVGEFLSGALAGAMTKAVLAPLETIRTRMVVGVGSKNIGTSFIQVIEQQGWKGLWAGNTINMLRIIPTQAIELATFECVKRAMNSAQEKWINTGNPKLQIGNASMSFSLSWLSPVAVAGAAAGVAGTLACHPLEVLKDRLTVNPEVYPSLCIAVHKIYKEGGIGGLYAGLGPTIIGMLPYSTCYYFMYETMKKSYCQAQKKKSLSRAEMLLIGAFSGLTASTISYPLEVARKRLMVGALHGKCPPHMVAALSEVIRDEGLLGLYRGWGASCLKVMPSSGITWMFYEAWKDILLADRRHVLQ
ncbi:putative mitochondrial adenine nucleotide transporter BTL1 [Nicotiana tabacum]|uniref:Mitochondrial adenine nucleotide transporter BTL1 n=1 Tax=Nicotiana tabacum TaxID=4097 RepID=A0A1S3ZF87_TOBAC|nr:probable mitochondrial adenine nucleotide transporter BTL1 [Nicotiana tomentosiformis]XP_016462946.1 PREDICTED: probable mitochondrial adenine nucleotide transporter BTL1 [Nicotiana tabacum]